MRAIASGVVVAAVVALGASSSEGRARTPGPLLLVALPSLGTVTWRCEPGGKRKFALGYRASSRYATTEVVLRASGRLVARRTIQPGERMRMPFLAARSQRLSFVQATGAGTLQASVTVDFGLSSTAGYCRDYSPPGVLVRVSPRR